MIASRTLPLFPRRLVGFGRDVNVLTLLQLQLAVATDNSSHAFDHDPLFARECRCRLSRAPGFTSST